jgi:hypothetical protein|tara:strand:+ start:2849 stop:3052 length:204 start_codon:yes stop_codon:yes gene_type:complete
MAKKKENKWKSYGVPLAEPITGNVDSAFFDIDLAPQRKEDETKEEYKARRKEGNRRIKLHRRGRKVN